MERITYQKTLDVHKNGIQFTLQGVETGDNLSRVIEMSLMASGDAIDFPLENLLPIMYVTTPKATEPSIIECTIKDNTVVYEVLPIVEEGITEMQLKLIETSPEGAKRVLVAPRFAVEVTKSNVNDGSAIQKSEFTALETAVAKAKAVYDKRFLCMEIDSNCIFKAYYADGTIYETDILKELFHNGESLLSQSYARGGTGVRTGEDTDNSMYYSNVSQSASLEAKDVIENSEEILKEVRLHGVYTAFSVDFETGEVEYVSPTYNFKINLETGELETDGGVYSFEDEIGRIVVKWLEENNVDITKLQAIGVTHTEEINALKIESLTHTEKLEIHTEKLGEIDKIVNRSIVNSLLWENASPSSDFEAQTITLASNDFDYLMIETVSTITDNPDMYNVAFVSRGRSLMVIGLYANMNDNQISSDTDIFRVVTVSEDGKVHFSASNTYYYSNYICTAKPYKIYGIKLGG